MNRRKKLIKELDRVFSLYIRARDGRCVCCGKTDKLTCGHVFSSAHYSARWDEVNAYCQCVGCNFLHEQDPYPYYKYVIGRIGQKRFDLLHMRYSTPAKFTVADIEMLLNKYRKKLQEITNGILD